MATVLDIGFLNYFAPLFTFLLIFGLMYGILQKVKLLGDNKGLNMMGAITIALLFIIAPKTSKLVEVATPWFIMFLIFVVVAMLFFLVLGVKPSAIEDFAMDPAMVWTFIIILFIIGGIAMTQVFGEDIKDITDPDVVEEEGNFMGGIAGIIFDPRVLGAFLVLAVASQAVRLISKGF